MKANVICHINGKIIVDYPIICNSVEEADFIHVAKENLIEDRLISQEELDQVSFIVKPQ